MKGAIVFDLDGTLIDSAPDIHVALNKTLADEGAPAVTLTQTIGFIGHGIPNLVRQAREALAIDPARQEPMTAAMFAHYLAAPSVLTRPYEGVVDCLDALTAAGHPLGLCTNKALEPTLEILDAQPRRLLEVTGLGQKTLTGITEHHAQRHGPDRVFSGPRRRFASVVEELQQPRALRCGEARI